MPVFCSNVVTATITMAHFLWHAFGMGKGAAAGLNNHNNESL